MYHSFYKCRVDPMHERADMGVLICVLPEREGSHQLKFQIYF